MTRWQGTSSQNGLRPTAAPPAPAAPGAPRRRAGRAEAGRPPAGAATEGRETTPGTGPQGEGRVPMTATTSRIASSIASDILPRSMTADTRPAPLDLPAIEIVLPIEGMTCASCVNRIARFLKKTEGGVE